METVVKWLVENPYVITFILGMFAGVLLGKRF